MERGHFPLDLLPSWCSLNGVTFSKVSVADIDGRGLGLVANEDLALAEDNDHSRSPLLTISNDLILSASGVKEYARQSRDFSQLLDVAGHQSQRIDILLFLLAQFVLSSRNYSSRPGLKSPWTQYFNLLPQTVPIPTLWSEAERNLLRGTSLEAAVSAKLAALRVEFDAIRERTQDLESWNELLDHDGPISLHDWTYLDAVYRSRSLGLPQSGESMVPCLDLVNHSSPATAYFEQDTNDEVLLLLRKDAKLKKGDEITIDYGADKSAGEMLFSYGFIDANATTKSVVLPVEAMDDDPLSKAKLHVFGSSPTLRITVNESGVLEWSSPFIYLMSLNQEDGLTFQILQETDGSQHLRMFWQDRDVTDEAEDVEKLIRGHEMQQIFRLRAVTIVLETVQQKLEMLTSHSVEETSSKTVRVEISQAASHLRGVERNLFETALQMLDDERSRLFEDESVLAYLGSMEAEHDEGIDGPEGP
ncbi:hypothetical protein F5Y18DRAFT_419813 [Xylariaceae sp. FL1019]|nr:hypothetical protein F5Y18DRAFT_419813 [Xylariaceae sp. FL1019]